MRGKFSILIASCLILLESCTIEKRVHLSGYHVEWGENNNGGIDKEIEANHNQNLVIDSTEPKSEVEKIINEISKPKEINSGEFIATESKVYYFKPYVKWEYLNPDENFEINYRHTRFGIPVKALLNAKIYMWLQKDEGNGFKNISNSNIMICEPEKDYDEMLYFIELDLKEGDKIRIMFDSNMSEKVKLKYKNLLQ